MSNTPPQMGDRVREIITNQSGLITGESEYLWGCRQLLVYIDGEKDKDGKPATEWWDENRLEVLERGVVVPIEYDERPALASAGPDRPAPVR